MAYNGSSYFGSRYFGSRYFLTGAHAEIVLQDGLRGGPGGSNKAGKKKHAWERRGHVISAIQSGPTLDYVNLLLEDTQKHLDQTSVIDAYILDNYVEIASLEELIAVISDALKQQELSDQSNAEKNKLRIDAHSYKVQIREEYHKRLIRRKREDEALIHILLHAC